MAQQLKGEHRGTLVHPVIFLVFSRVHLIAQNVKTKKK